MYETYRKTDEVQTYCMPAGSRATVKCCADESLPTANISAATCLLAEPAPEEVVSMTPLLCDSGAEDKKPSLSELLVVEVDADKFKVLPLEVLALRGRIQIYEQISDAQEAAMTAQWAQVAGPAQATVNATRRDADDMQRFSWSVNITGITEPGRWVFRLTATLPNSAYSSWNEVAVVVEDRRAKSMPRELLDLHATWLDNSTRDCLPMIINKRGVSANSFHVEIGRGGYFPTESGTSEGQFSMIRANMVAYEATGASHFLDRALFLADPLEEIFYGREIPEYTDTRPWAAHWLINAKNDFQSKGPTAAQPQCNFPPCNYQNAGAFDQLLKFVNGVTYIKHGPAVNSTYNNGDRVSKVFKAYREGGSLSWQNVLAGLVVGEELPIHYYIDQNTEPFVVAGESDPMSWQSIDYTSMVSGKVVLWDKNFTGELLVVYNTYSGAIIRRNMRFEAWPNWREMRPNEVASAFDAFYWAHEAYKLLHRFTGDERWERARVATLAVIDVAAVVENPIKYFQTMTTNAKPIDMGTQVMSMDVKGRQVTPMPFSRLPDGTAKLSLDHGDPMPDGSPNLRTVYQQSNIVAQLSNDTLISASMASDSVGVISIALSIAPSGFTSFYQASFVTGGSNKLRTELFHHYDFVKYSLATTWRWYDPGEPYTERQPSPKEEILQWNDGDVNVPAKRFNFTNAGAWGGVRLFREGRAEFPSALQGITYSLLGKPMRLIIEDNDHYLWQAEMPPTNGSVSRDWKPTNFTYRTDWNPNPIGCEPISGIGCDVRDKPYDTPSPGTIFRYEFVLNPGEGHSVVTFFYMGSAPLFIPADSYTYKCQITSFTPGKSTMLVGEVFPIDSPTGVLAYNPGVWPFTFNLIGNDYALEDWRGTPYIGYQAPMPWMQMGKPEQAAQVFNFLMDAQDHYTAQSPSKIEGPFTPVYIWPRWDNLEYGDVGTFTWGGPDPNTFWGGFQGRAAEAAARCWYEFKDDPTLPSNAALVVNRYVNFLFDFMSKQGAFNVTGGPRPPTTFREAVDPIFEYHEPHMMALYMRTAIYGKLSGANSTRANVVIESSLDYFKLLYYTDEGRSVNPIVNPPKTPSNPGGSLYYGFWAGEVMEALALYLTHHVTFLVEGLDGLSLLVDPDLTSEITVRLEVTPPPGAIIAVSIGGGYLLVEPAVLQFDSSTWKIPQKVSVRIDNAAVKAVGVTLSNSSGRRQLQGSLLPLRQIALAAAPSGDDEPSTNQSESASVSMIERLAPFLRLVSSSSSGEHEASGHSGGTYKHREKVTIVPDGDQCIVPPLPPCEDATVEGQPTCTTSITWAMTTGIIEHPDWYAGMDCNSTFAAFQLLLHGLGDQGCPLPCTRRDVDESHRQRCGSGGICVDGMGEFTCRCLAGFSGLFCRTDVDECLSEPCLNGGKCFDSSTRNETVSVNLFFCDCPSGWAGLTCAEVDKPLVTAEIVGIAAAAVVGAVLVILMLIYWIIPCVKACCICCGCMTKNKQNHQKKRTKKTKKPVSTGDDSDSGYSYSDSDSDSDSASDSASDSDSGSPEPVFADEDGEDSGSDGSDGSGRDGSGSGSESSGSDSGSDSRKPPAPPTPTVTTKKGRGYGFDEEMSGSSGGSSGSDNGELPPEVPDIGAEEVELARTFELDFDDEDDDDTNVFEESVENVTPQNHAEHASKLRLLSAHLKELDPEEAIKMAEHANQIEATKPASDSSSGSSYSGSSDSDNEGGPPPLPPPPVELPALPSDGSSSGAESSSGFGSSSSGSDDDDADATAAVASTKVKAKGKNKGKGKAKGNGNGNSKGNGKGKGNGNGKGGAPPPPPPPPSCCSAPKRAKSSGGGGGRSDLLSAFHGGAALHHTETVDHSAPTGVAQTEKAGKSGKGGKGKGGKVGPPPPPPVTSSGSGGGGGGGGGGRGDLLSAIAGGARLHHTVTVDKSAPVVGPPVAMELVYSSLQYGKAGPDGKWKSKKPPPGMDMFTESESYEHQFLMCLATFSEAPCYIGSELEEGAKEGYGQVQKRARGEAGEERASGCRRPRRR
jgi:hypothetical protein